MFSDGDEDPSNIEVSFVVFHFIVYHFSKYRNIERRIQNPIQDLR